jgi:hypothetical protein
VDLDSVADELYGLPPGEFTSARNARAKQARADGDRELSQQVSRLEKPTTAAWLVNRLAREHAEQLEPLIALGQDLREATSNISGDELRSLTRQRHQVVSALVQQARRLGSEAGVKVSDAVAGDVQQTLDASLADPDAADAVLRGRLTHALEYAGFGPGAGGIAPAPAGRDARASGGSKGGSKGGTGRGAKVADLAARRRDGARQALDDAQRALDDAQADHRTAEADRTEATNEHRAAVEDVERLRAELERAEESARAAGKAERAAEQRARRAAQAVERAERARDEAKQRLAELGS